MSARLTGAAATDIAGAKQEIVREHDDECLILQVLIVLIEAAVGQDFVDHIIVAQRAVD